MFDIVKMYGVIKNMSRIKKLICCNTCEALMLDEWVDALQTQPAPEYTVICSKCGAGRTVTLNMGDSNA